MNLYEMTDAAIAEEIGYRIRQLRLRNNIPLELLHERTLIAINTLKALESGKGKLTTMIAVLRELKALDGINNFIAPVEISPIQLIKLKGKQRKRARLPKHQDQEWPDQW